MRRILVMLLCAVGWAGVTGCRQAPEEHGAAPLDAQARAKSLAERTLLVDTHIDVPYRLMEHMEDISRRTEKGDFDYPRAVAGGLNAAFMSIYVPASYQEEGGAKQYADKLIDLVEGFARDWPDKFTLVDSAADVERAFAQRKIALAMGMENGAPIEDDLANVGHFFERGIRYITLTHSKNNQICDSSYDDERKWHGLSPFGRRVVEEMNRLGIMVDVSHVSDDTFFQVMEMTKAPPIASHSSSRHFTPGWERNMSDDMIKRLAEKGGVIQINFGSAFLTKEANEQSLAYYDALDRHREANDLAADDEAATEAFSKRYWNEHARAYADISDVVAHIEHVIELAGIDHVGIGSDFDGVGDSLPTGLKDVSQYPNLVRALLEKGHPEADIRKICGGNLLRVWSEVERTARRLQRAD